MSLAARRPPRSACADPRTHPPPPHTHTACGVVALLGCGQSAVGCGLAVCVWGGGSLRRAIALAAGRRCVRYLHSTQTDAPVSRCLLATEGSAARGGRRSRDWLRDGWIRGPGRHVSRASATGALMAAKSGLRMRMRMLTCAHDSTDWHDDAVAAAC